MTVEVLESGLVIPSKETPRHGIWLSNLDRVAIKEYTPTVYIYRPNGDPDFFSVETLKSSLRKALVPFYPLAGRLGLDQDGRVEIKCSGEGALFVVACSKSTVNDLGDFAPSPEMQMLVPSAESIEQPPSILLLLQVTFFKCGGVALGVATHHTAVDGQSALHFVNTWSDIARGCLKLTHHPFFDRTLLRPRSPPAVLFDHIAYTRKPQTIPPPGGYPPSVPAILKLSKAQLTSLKNNSKGLSTFRAIVAHLWRCSCIARGLEPDQETWLYLAADARDRLRPPLPPGFFGNTIIWMAAVATAGQIMSDPFGLGAKKIRDATDRLDDEYLRSVVDFLEEDRKETQMGLQMTDLLAVSWLGLPIYEADFGWGKPEFMGRTSNFPGVVFITRSPGDDGGVSIPLAFEPETMPKFRKVFYEELDRVGGV